MYTYFLLTNAGIDFVVDAPLREEAIAYVQKILQECNDAQEIVCCRPVYESADVYFQVTQ